MFGRLSIAVVVKKKFSVDKETRNDRQKKFLLIDSARSKRKKLFSNALATERSESSGHFRFIDANEKNDENLKKKKKLFYMPLGQQLESVCIDTNRKTYSDEIE